MRVDGGCCCRVVLNGEEGVCFMTVITVYRRRQRLSDVEDHETSRRYLTSLKQYEIQDSRWSVLEQDGREIR